MAYRSILVHLDDDPRCDARIDLAARLAAERDARLVGIAPTGWIEQWLPSAAGGQQLALLAEALREDAEARVLRFQERCCERSLKAASAFVDEASTAWSMIDHGHCHDLLVMGQPDPARRHHRAQRAELEQVLLEASRPVLLVPYAGRFETLGQTVLLAWNGRRESARAAAEAMPLLTQARVVHLIQFHGSRSESPSGHRPGDVSEATEWLRWHGVEVQTHSEGTDIDVGEALLSRASDLGADLIVAGAYGHARLTEWVLGGATKSLLDAMTVPVLMAR